MRNLILSMFVMFAALLGGCYSSHEEAQEPPVLCDEPLRFTAPGHSEYCTGAEEAYRAEADRLGCGCLHFECYHAWQSVGFAQTGVDTVAAAYATAEDCAQLEALMDNPRPALQCEHDRFPECRP